MQPIKDDWEEEEENEEKKEELVGKQAYSYLNRPKSDEIFGVRKKVVIIILETNTLLLLIMILLLKMVVKYLMEQMVYGN